MAKKISLFSLLFIGVIILIGCSANDSTLVYNYDDSEYSQNVVEYLNIDTPERKIIYTVDISFDVRDLDDATTYLKSLIESDEWFDSESETGTRHSYRIRIKTDRLDAFIESLSDEYTVRSYEKTGDDISLEYQDTANRILALQAQLDRLLELYDEASISEMIIINAQISDIEVELQELNGDLNHFDSLVDYSVVNLVFYGNVVNTNAPFFNRLGNAVVNGFTALVQMFDALAIALATVLPFVIVVGGAGIGALVLFKKRKVKKTSQEKSQSIGTEEKL